jgi:hypothetical protein
LSHTSEYLSDTSEPQPVDFAADWLGGVGEVALYMYGADTKKARREVYRLASEVPPEDQLPLFKMGPGKWCGRKSTILAWIRAKEAARLAAAKEAARLAAEREALRQAAEKEAQGLATA